MLATERTLLGLRGSKVGCEGLLLAPLHARAGSAIQQSRLRWVEADLASSDWLEALGVIANRQ
jgi:hypothetical protein